MSGPIPFGVTGQSLQWEPCTPVPPTCPTPDSLGQSLRDSFRNEETKTKNRYRTPPTLRVLTTLLLYLITYTLTTERNRPVRHETTNVRGLVSSRVSSRQRQKTFQVGR